MSYSEFDFFIAGTAAVFAVDFGPTAQQILVLIDNGAFTVYQLANVFDEHDNASLKAVILRMVFGHLQVTGLAQHDGGGRIAVLVVVVDKVRLAGKGVEAVLTAGFEEDAAFSLRCILADKVLHIVKANDKVLAVHAVDLDRGRFYGGLHAAEPER